MHVHHRRFREVVLVDGSPVLTAPGSILDSGAAHASAASFVYQHESAGGNASLQKLGVEVAASRDRDRRPNTLRALHH